VVDVKMKLAALYERHADDMGDHAWPSEGERWGELVFCVLVQCGGESTEATRRAVSILEQLALLSPSKLASMQPGSPEQSAFAHVLSCAGFAAEESARTLQLLPALARAVNGRYGGKLQRLVRSHAEQLRDALVTEFASPHLGEAQLREAMSHWLQNAFNLPLSLQNKVVSAFCEANNLTIETLTAAIDDLDLNLALVDDILAAENARPEEGA